MHRLKAGSHWCLILIIFTLIGGGCAWGDEASPSQADEKQPLWEFGVAGAAARLPHYIGSDEYETYYYPLPYLIYRGEILRANREGIRGIFYKGENFETSISLWGNPPVPEDNQAREGMPELDAIGEIGPSMRYYLYRHGWQDHLYLQTALRTTYSFDFNGGFDVDMDYQGWHGGIDLSYQNKRWFADRNLSIYFKAGLHFADSLYNNYFYGVPAQYARPGRDQFEADGGYAGLSISGSAYKELTSKLSIGCYVRWNNVNGAVFEDSPLVRDKNNYAIGALLVWKLAESSKPAPVKE